MQILCLGLSHRTAPIQLRERLNYPAPALSAALARFGCGESSRPAGLCELVILSTCNRLELYACAGDAPGTQGQDPFAPLLEFLAETRELPLAEFKAHLYRYTGVEAVEHLCRVAAGLDSLVLGEPQILGQVAEAHKIGVGQGAAGTVLSALFLAAIRAGKRARTETAISRNPASISSVAVRLAEQAIGGWADRSVLVIGAGEMGELTVEALRARGVRQIAVANRTYQRATELAERWSAKALSFERLTEAIHQADLVIVSTGAPHTIVNRDVVREAMTGRTERPLVFIDIAIPRNVDPAVGDIAHVHVYDIDDLHARLEGAIADRQSEVPRVEAIVAQEVATFEEWLDGLNIMPVVADLRSKAEQIRQRELERTLRHLPDLDPQTREHIQYLTEALVNKLLHEPTLRLKAEATNGHAAEYAAAVRYLFALNG